jgi:hypothetical protein
MDKGSFWRGKKRITNVIVVCCAMSIFASGASAASRENTPPHRSDVATRSIGQSLALLPRWRVLSNVFVSTSSVATNASANSITDITLVSTTSSSPTNTSFLQGAYVGPVDPSGIKAFESATGSKLTVASDYLPSNGGWAGMDGAGGSLSWLTNAWQSSGFTLSLGVPMIPTNAQGAAQGTLAIGATGAYNGYFVTLAQALVAAGEGNSYLRLGWEFDGNWYPWQATTPIAEANYAQYFQQIVTAMRSVDGGAFEFVWNPDGSAFTSSNYSIAAAYPGNAYVNLIGIDLYDMSWGNSLTSSNLWNSATLPALSTADNFAKAQGKSLAICEWGVQTRQGHGLGDDPLYVNNMAAWMDAPDHNVAYESYFDGITQSGVEDQFQIATNGLFPDSRAAFGADFG